MGIAWYAEPVDHDPATAAAAAFRLALMASAVGEALGSLQAGVTAATDGWSGRSRHVFDAEAPAVVDAGHALVGTLLDAAAAVRARSQAAQDEAARRSAVAAERSADALNLAGADAGSDGLDLFAPAGGYGG